MKTTTKRVATKRLPFSRLTAKQKRIAIAEDVLLRLDARQLDPVQGVYVKFKSTTEITQGENLKSRLKSPGLTCVCCAIGAAVVALAAKENRMELMESYHINQIHISNIRQTDQAKERARAALGAKLNHVIEASYEGWNYVKSLTPWGSYDTRDFYLHHPNNVDRLRAIYTQVARTGTFDPTK